MTLRHVAVGDARYAVRVAGSGAPVLLLHGFTGTGRSWDPLARRLRVAGYRTIAPDLLGHGRSDAPADPVRHDVARQAADLATILATLDAVPAVVVGYSLGGRVALRLALDRPHAVRSLVLIGAGAGTADDRTRARRRAEEAALAGAIEREGIVAFVDRWEALPLFATEAALPPRVRAARRDERLSQSPEGLAASLRGAGQGAQQPLHSRLVTLRVPTLLVVGERDTAARSRAEAIVLAAPRRLVRVVVEPGAGHAVHLEREARFGDMVLARLAANAGSPPGDANAGSPPSGGAVVGTASAAGAPASGATAAGTATTPSTTTAAGAPPSGRLPRRTA